MCCCQQALHYTRTSFLGGFLEHPVSLRTISLALCACEKEENLFFIVKVVEFILLQSIIKKLFKKTTLQLYVFARFPFSSSANTAAHDAGKLCTRRTEAPEMQSAWHPEDRQVVWTLPPYPATMQS